MYIGNVGNIQRYPAEFLETLRCMYIGNVGNIQLTACSIT